MSSLMRVKSYVDETQGKRTLEILDGFFLDHFSDLFVTFLGPFSLTILSTILGLGGGLLTLKERWEADLKYSGRDGRRITTCIVSTRRNH